MQHDPRAWLWEVREAADSVADFIKVRSLTGDLGGQMLRAAIERKFEVIGSALDRLSAEAPDIAARIPELPHTVAMRNALIHGDHPVANETVWRTVQHDLPKLRAQAAALLTELGDEP